MEYRVKDKNQNTSDQAYVKPTRGRGNMRGGRGGDYNRDREERGDYKPRGGRGQPREHQRENENRPREYDNRPRDKDNRPPFEKKQRPDMDTNSWQYKYKNEKRISYENK